MITSAGIRSAQMKTMRKIPTELRERLAADPRMKVCAAAHLGDCEGRIEWHHVWIYAGKQINEYWSIVGACHYHHSEVNSNREVREAFERVSLGLATFEDLHGYPRKNWEQIETNLYSHED